MNQGVVMAGSGFTGENNFDPKDSVQLGNDDFEPAADEATVAAKEVTANVKNADIGDGDTGSASPATVTTDSAPASNTPTDTLKEQVQKAEEGQQFGDDLVEANILVGEDGNLLGPDGLVQGQFLDDLLAGEKNGQPGLQEGGLSGEPILGDLQGVENNLFGQDSLPIDFGSQSPGDFGPSEFGDFGLQGSGDFGPGRFDGFGPQAPGVFGPTDLAPVSFGSDFGGYGSFNDFSFKLGEVGPSFGPQAPGVFGPTDFAPASFGSDFGGLGGFNDFNFKPSEVGLSFGPQAPGGFGPTDIAPVSFGSDFGGLGGFNDFNFKPSEVGLSFGPQGPSDLVPSGFADFGPQGPGGFNDFAFEPGETGPNFGPQGGPGDLGPTGFADFGPQGPGGFGPTDFGPASFDPQVPGGVNDFSFKPGELGPSFDSQGPGAFGQPGFGPSSFGPQSPGDFGPEGFNDFGSKGPVGFVIQGPGNSGPVGFNDFGSQGPSNFRGLDNFEPQESQVNSAEDFIFNLQGEESNQHIQQQQGRQLGDSIEVHIDAGAAVAGTPLIVTKHEILNLLGIENVDGLAISAAENIVDHQNGTDFVFTASTPGDLVTHLEIARPNQPTINLYASYDVAPAIILQETISLGDIDAYSSFSLTEEQFLAYFDHEQSTLQDYSVVVASTSTAVATVIVDNATGNFEITPMTANDGDELVLQYSAVDSATGATITVPVAYNVAAVSSEEKTELLGNLFAIYNLQNKLYVSDSNTITAEDFWYAHNGIRDLFISEDSDTSATLVRLEGGSYQVYPAEVGDLTLTLVVDSPFEWMPGKFYIKLNYSVDYGKDIANIANDGSLEIDHAFIIDNFSNQLPDGALIESFYVDTNPNSPVSYNVVKNIDGQGVLLSSSSGSATGEIWFGLVVTVAGQDDPIQLSAIADIYSPSIIELEEQVEASVETRGEVSIDDWVIANKIEGVLASDIESINVTVREGSTADVTISSQTGSSGTGGAGKLISLESDGNLTLDVLVELKDGSRMNLPLSYEVLPATVVELEPGASKVYTRNEIFELLDIENGNDEMMILVFAPTAITKTEDTSIVQLSEYYARTKIDSVTLSVADDLGEA